MNKSNIVILLLFCILLFQLCQTTETFVSRYDIDIAMKALNAIKPKAMKRITYRSLHKHIKDIRDMIESQAKGNDLTLLNEYNKSTSVKDIFKLMKNRKFQGSYRSKTIGDRPDDFIRSGIQQSKNVSSHETAPSGITTIGDRPDDFIRSGIQQSKNVSSHETAPSGNATQRERRGSAEKSRGSAEKSGGSAEKSGDLYTNISKTFMI